MKKLLLFCAAGLLTSALNQSYGQCDLFNNSTITEAAEESQMLQWIDPAFHFEAQLLFRATDDGFSSTDFHAQSDGFTNTVTLIKTSDGYIFGGFNEGAWDGDVNGYYDGGHVNNFIFELNTNVKYPIRPDRIQYCTYNRNTYGPTFGGGHDIYIESNLQGGYTYTWAYEPETGPFEGQNTLMGGSYNGWLIEDLEVWHLQTTGTAVSCDSDGDGISDDDELNVYFTDPYAADTDGDLLNDFEELFTYGTNPLEMDTDGDMVTDYGEVMVTETDPTLMDTDGDGCDDLTQATFNCPGQTVPGCQTDLSGDGYVDTIDLLIFLGDIGKTCD